MPVRKIPKNYRSVTGKFYSHKNSASIGFESTLERDLFLALEFDDTVESYEEQPLTITGSHEGRTIKYTPDCLAKCVDGAEILFEVKYTSDLEKEAEDLAGRFSVAERYSHEHGLEFRVVTEKDIRGLRLENQRFVYGYATPPREIERLRRPIISQLKRPLPLESLLSALAPDRIKQAAYIPAIWHLVFIGALKVDMDIPISNKTTIQVNHGTNIS